MNTIGLDVKFTIIIHALDYGYILEENGKYTAFEDWSGVDERLQSLLADEQGA